LQFSTEIVVYLGNATIYSPGSLIGSHRQLIDPRQFQWLRVTLKGGTRFSGGLVVKVRGLGLSPPPLPFEPPAIV